MISISASFNDQIIEETWINKHTLPPILPMPLPDNPNILLDPKGISVDNHAKITLTLCKTCHSSIQSKKTPPLSLANHMFLGDVPDELKDLTVVEEAMIAKCRAKCWVIQLKELVFESPVFGLFFCTFEPLKLWQ
jgi:hypothetical protein